MAMRQKSILTAVFVQTENSGCEQHICTCRGGNKEYMKMGVRSVDTLKGYIERQKNRSGCVLVNCCVEEGLSLPALLT